MCFARIGDNEQTSFGAGDWGGVPPGIEQWASEVKRYVEIDAEIPDLWAELRRESEFLADVQHNDTRNTPFTQAEQEQIVAQLQEIKNRIREQFELTAEQFEHIDARLDEAEEASKRIGRKDWFLLFGGTILNLIVTDTVTPSVAGHIYTMVIQGIVHLFGGGPPQILA